MRSTFARQFVLRPTLSFHSHLSCVLDPPSFAFVVVLPVVSSTPFVQVHVHVQGRSFPFALDAPRSFPFGCSAFHLVHALFRASLPLGVAQQAAPVEAGNWWFADTGFNFKRIGWGGLPGGASLPMEPETKGGFRPGGLGVDRGDLKGEEGGALPRGRRPRTKGDVGMGSRCMRTDMTRVRGCIPQREHPRVRSTSNPGACPAHRSVPRST